MNFSNQKQVGGRCSEVGSLHRYVFEQRRRLFFAVTKKVVIGVESVRIPPEVQAGQNRQVKKREFAMKKKRHVWNIPRCLFADAVGQLNSELAMTVLTTEVTEVLSRLQ